MLVVEPRAEEVDDPSAFGRGRRVEREERLEALVRGCRGQPAEQKTPLGFEEVGRLVEHEAIVRQTLTAALVARVRQARELDLQGLAVGALRAPDAPLAV